MSNDVTTYEAGGHRAQSYVFNHTLRISANRLFCCSNHFPSSTNVVGAPSSEEWESTDCISVGATGCGSNSTSDSGEGVRGLHVRDQEREWTPASFTVDFIVTAVSSCLVSIGP